MASSDGINWKRVGEVAWKVFQPVLIAMLVALLLQLGWSPAGEEPDLSVAGITHFSNVTTTGDVVVGDDLTVTDRATVTGALEASSTFAVVGASELGGAVEVLGATTLSSGLDVTGAATVSGVSAIGTFQRFTAATAISVTAGSTITPTGTYQPIKSSEVAPVTTSTSTAISNGSTVGYMLILVNTNVTQTITIDDGGNTHLSGDAVLGNDDTLWLIWDGADWVEIAQANNT